MLEQQQRVLATSDSIRRLYTKFILQHKEHAVSPTVIVLLHCYACITFAKVDYFDALHTSVAEINLNCA